MFQQGGHNINLTALVIQRQIVFEGKSFLETKFHLWPSPLKGQERILATMPFREKLSVQKYEDCVTPGHSCATTQRNSDYIIYTLQFSFRSLGRLLGGGCTRSLYSEESN